MQFKTFRVHHAQLSCQPCSADSTVRHSLAGNCDCTSLPVMQASNAKKFAGFFDLVVRDFQVLHRLKDLLVLETFSAGVQQQLATWLLSHGSAWQAQQKITGEEAAKLITAYKASPSALQVLLSPPCGLEQALEKRALTRKWVLETILVEGSQQLLDVVLREATWLLADLPEVTRCGPAVPALPLDTFIAWLDAGMRPDMRVVMVSEGCRLTPSPQQHPWTASGSL